MFAQPTECAFDDIAQTVGLAIERVSSFAGRIVGDDRRGTSVEKQASKGIAVVGAIGKTQGRRHGADEAGRHGRIAAMTRSDDQPSRSAVLVDGGMDFRRAAAARAADRLEIGPPFPPAAERCAFTCVVSSITAAGGPPASANCTNIPSQTPLRAQRTNRL